MKAIDRRRLLMAAAALPLGLAGGMPLAVRRSRAAPPTRTLVLVELNGGNDGLNTVVPYRDPAYARARPKLAVKAGAVLKLDENLGLHPALEPLMAAWQDGDLGIALGVGYPRPNRSHFRSIEIWNTASTSEETLQQGWLNSAVAESNEPLPLKESLGVILGGAAGPLAGDALTSVVMKDRKQLRKAARLLNGGGSSANPALDHILAVRRQAHDAATRIEARLADAAALNQTFPNNGLGRQLQQAAAMIAAEAPAAVIKVQQGGYDTHAGQAGRHRRLLDELASGLSAFRQALKQAGAWERCRVIT